MGKLGVLFVLMILVPNFSFASSASDHEGALRLVDKLKSRMKDRVKSVRAKDADEWYLDMSESHEASTSGAEPSSKKHPAQQNNRQTNQTNQTKTASTEVGKSPHPGNLGAGTQVYTSAKGLPPPHSLDLDELGAKGGQVVLVVERLERPRRSNGVSRNVTGPSELTVFLEGPDATTKKVSETLEGFRDSQYFRVKEILVYRLKSEKLAGTKASPVSPKEPNSKEEIRSKTTVSETPKSVAHESDLLGSSESKKESPKPKAKSPRQKVSAPKSALEEYASRFGKNSAVARHLKRYGKGSGPLSLLGAAAIGLSDAVKNEAVADVYEATARPESHRQSSAEGTAQ